MSTRTAIDERPALGTGEAFRALVAGGGHVVEEWFTDHDDDERVVLYGDCSRCMTELTLRDSNGAERPSKEAARPCPASGGDFDEDWS